MAEAQTSRRVAYWTLFLGLCSLIMFVKLLPLRPGPGAIPGPDLLVAITFAWVIRRPDYIPAWLVAGVFLIEDLMLMRPPGLWAAIVVVAFEYLRNRSATVRDSTFWSEWLTVAIVITGMFLANALIMGLFVVNQPGFGLILIRMILTIAMYPIVVLLAAKSLGLKRISPSEADKLGSRL